MSGVSDTVVVDDLDQFIQLLVRWHQNKVAVLEHVLGVPEGTEVSFNDEGPQTLTGDLHKGFLIGLSLGLMELGTLPFGAEVVGNDNPAAPDEPVH